VDLSGFQIGGDISSAECVACREDNAVTHRALCCLIGVGVLTKGSFFPGQTEENDTITGEKSFHANIQMRHVSRLTNCAVVSRSGNLFPIAPLKGQKVF
jgi:hypothetical protein